ncbi:MAG: hypothetical protein ACOVME_00890, partial [Rhodobacter sp.]
AAAPPRAPAAPPPPPPGVAWLVLLVAPVAGVFVAAGAGMALAAAIAGRLHPRLGAERPSQGAARAAR